MKPALRKKAVRTLFLLHRWSGITLGLMMCIWCLSGVVMLWKAWPQRNELQAALAHNTISLEDPAVLPPLKERYRAFRVLMAGRIPLLLAYAETGIVRTYDLRNGRPYHLSPEDLAGNAVRYVGLTAGSAHFEGLRDHDQWILNTKGHQSGFYRFAMDDPDRNVVYLSPETGDVMQATTRNSRFWSWFGAIPHWLYPSLLKRHQTAWVYTLCVLSGSGVALTTTGLWIGWRRIRSGKSFSPYRGFHRLHHVSGIVFGLMLLSWITTGFLSMNPAGFLARGPVPEWTKVFEGFVSRGELSQVMTELHAHPECGLRDIRLSSWSGIPFIAATTENGESSTLDISLNSVPLTQEDIEKTLTRNHVSARVITLGQDDTYYFSTRHFTRFFPVFRVTGPDGVRAYLDTRTGTPLLIAESGTKGSRWIIYGPHDLDFFPWLRQPIARLIIVLPLLLGVSTLCLSGFLLGIKRLGYRITTTRKHRQRQDSLPPRD